METLSIVKGINKARYSIIKYIRVLLLLSRKSNIGELILIEITINIYLINNLRANILIRIDIIRLKKINIITIKRYIYIISYNIKIPIKIKL